MPHFKCVGCRTRLYSASARADLVFDLCPSCGSLLEPVGELTEIVGFQSITRAMVSQDVSHEAAAEAIALAVPDGDP
jgi:Zn-finger nucleic acid-binding protein